MYYQAIAAAHTFFDRVTGPPAQAAIRQSGILNAETRANADPLIIFDAAGGTGDVTLLLHREEALKDCKMRILSGDISPPMSQMAVKLLKDLEGAEAKVIDAQVFHFTQS